MSDAPNRPPLWRAMDDAMDAQANREVGQTDTLVWPLVWRRIRAAEICALRDWLVPEESIEDAPGRFVNGCCLEDRQRLRALLTTEADRAERGE